MTNAWMVRSDGGAALPLFEEKGIVGIHFGVTEDLAGKDLDGIRVRLREINPDNSVHEIGGAAGPLNKIVNVMKPGDGVITYDPGKRVYWVGEITGDYYFEPGTDELPQRRSVIWKSRLVSRDDLQISTRNSLGGPSTLIQLSPEVWEEIQAVMAGNKPTEEVDSVETREAIQEDKRNMQEQARERLKDRIGALDPSEMEELLAALLRALGFKTWVSPAGPDRGVDVLASPDGLGLQEPRIKCEVKHRKQTAMGAPELRGFLGALRTGDRGIFLSTGGFTREARYEGERSNVPVTLLDLDDLARLIEANYEAFDTEGRGLLPLMRVYWPVD